MHSLRYSWMLDYLNIKNYRFFTELNVLKLSRVNLFSSKITLGKVTIPLKRYISHANRFSEPSDLGSRKHERS